MTTTPIRPWDILSIGKCEKHLCGGGYTICDELISENGIQFARTILRYYTKPNTEPAFEAFVDSARTGALKANLVIMCSKDKVRYEIFTKISVLPDVTVDSISEHIKTYGVV